MFYHIINIYCRHVCLKEIEFKREGESILLDNLRFRYNLKDDEDSGDNEGILFCLIC